jgi:hypothetical protein
MARKMAHKEHLYFVHTGEGIKVAIPEYALNEGEQKEFIIGYTVFSFDKMYESAFEYTAQNIKEVIENGKKTQRQ